MGRKLLWFVAIWAISVFCVGTFAEALHWLLMRG
jgi:hypothetical protein